MTQELKIPNLGNGEAGADTVSIEEFLQEVYDHNNSLLMPKFSFNNKQLFIFLI